MDLRYVEDILMRSRWVLTDYDVRCMKANASSEKRFKVADRLIVTREDMQTLKDDWLTDNVGFAWRDNPLGWDT